MVNVEKHLSNVCLHRNDIQSSLNCCAVCCWIFWCNKACILVTVSVFLVGIKVCVYKACYSVIV